MAGQLPIQFTELAQLNQLGIAPASIGFNTCTLESDSYVCVRQKVDDNDKPQVIIVNLKNNNEIVKRAISADSAIMHWKQDILALKAQGKTIQVFNLASKSKLKSTTMSEDVVFWKWFSENSLGLVTDTSVYHWNIFDPTQDAPVKMFERSPNLSGNQIINYRVSDDEQWMVVVGISQKEGRVAGSMQLYSKARGISQNIEGHAASFATLQAEGQPEPYKLFTFCVRTATSAKLHVVEIDPSPNNARFQKKAVDVYFPQEAVNDFPVAMQVSAKYSIIYMITKYGFIHLYDLETGTCIFMNRISNETIFVTAPDAESSGIVGINRKGQVLSVSLDENNAVPYLLQNPANTELATKLASRAGLAGADDLYRQQFENAFNSGNYQDAAKFAANSPRGFLRTGETINRFKNAQGGQGQMSVILQYFGLLLDKGKLNRYETVELIKPVLAQNRKQLLTKWMGEGKLEYSEELGDIVRLHDLEAALTIYREAGVPSKTVAALAETGRFEEILPYSTQVGYQPDFVQLLQHIVRVNPEKGAEFATQLANTEGGPMVDVGRVVDIFMSQNMVQQATAFLLDALKDNREDQGQLQTRLLEMNLLNAPQVADAILGNQMFTHYDKARISQLCEQAGLLQRALENTDDTAAIKRIIVQTDKLSPDFLQQYFSRLSVDQSLDVMNEMLTSNIRQNLQAVLQIATKFSELLGPSRLIELFERHRTAEGLYYFLGSIVNLSEDPDVVFKYLEAAVTMQQFTEVERICRENNFYDPQRVKAFLLEARLSEQLPLIIVCDRFNFVADLIRYLYQNQQYKSIEVFVQQVNPSRTPKVVSTLLSLDTDEQIIQNLLRSVDAAAISIDELVEEVESQNRLKLLLPFLEAALQAGNQSTAVANGLAKIYIACSPSLLPPQSIASNLRIDTLDSLTSLPSFGLLNVLHVPTSIMPKLQSLDSYDIDMDDIISIPSDDEIDGLDSEDLEIDVWDYVRCLLWTLLSETPDRIKNAGFDVALPNEETVEMLLSDVEFAPGLLEALTSSDPPSATFFKDLPKHEKGDLLWAIYVLVLEKSGHRNKIYIGCATAAQQGVQKRFNDYDREVLLAHNVEKAINDGYKIVHKRLLCWAKIPPVGERYAAVALFKAMEALFSLVFWAMYSRTKDYGLPHLCPWGLDRMEYDRTCSHTSLHEGIRAGMEGLDLEQIAQQEAAAEVRRLQNRKDYIERRKAENPQAWTARATAATKKMKAKARTAKKFFCDVCKTNCGTSSHYKIHLDGPRHKIKVAKAEGTYINPKKASHKAWMAKNKASKKYHCETCDQHFANRSELYRHYTSKQHKDRLAGMGMKTSASKRGIANNSRNASKASKKHCCKICDHAANSPSALARHRETKRHKEMVAALTASSS